LPTAHQSSQLWLPFNPDLTLPACLPAAACLPGCCRVDADSAAMDRAAAAYLQEQRQRQEEGGKGQEGAALRLWAPTALDQLLFALRSDPSIRVRREAIRVLSSVAVEVGSSQVGAVLCCAVL
jgi:hypothetical protein